MVHLADDEDWADNAGGETLQDDCLIVVDGYLGTIIGEGYRIGGRGRIIGLGGRWWWCIDASCRLVDINNVHDERIYQIKGIRGDSGILAANYLPQLAVLAMKEGVVERDRWSRPIKGAPSEPLNDEPEPETQRYLVETVCDRRRWNKEIVEPWLIQTIQKS